MAINSTHINYHYQLSMVTVLIILASVLFGICSAQENPEISEFDFNGSSQLNIELEHFEKKARVLFTGWHCIFGTSPTEQTRRTLTVLDAYENNFFILNQSQRNALKSLQASIAGIKTLNVSNRDLIKAGDYASTQAALVKFVNAVIVNAKRRISLYTDSKAFKDPVIISASNGVTSSNAINNCYKSATFQQLAQFEIKAAERVQEQLATLELFQVIVDSNKGDN